MTSQRRKGVALDAPELSETAAGLHVITDVGTCSVRVTPAGTICQTSPASATVVTVGATVENEVSR